MASRESEQKTVSSLCGHHSRNIDSRPEVREIYLRYSGVQNIPTRPAA